MFCEMAYFVYQDLAVKARAFAALSNYGMNPKNLARDMKKTHPAWCEHAGDILVESSNLGHKKGVSGRCDVSIFTSPRNAASHGQQERRR